MKRMQLTVSAEKLMNVEKKFGVRLGTSDPYAHIEICGGPLKGTDLGKTAVIDNCLNPEWTKIFHVDVDPKVFMPFKVSIYDHNDKRSDKLMVEAEFELTSVYQSDGNGDYREVDGGGRVHAHVTESLKGTDTGSFTLHLRGLNIKNVEPGVLLLGRSDPFFEIRKMVSYPDASLNRMIPVYRSATIKHNLNPLWDPLKISLEDLCYGMKSCRLKIQILDWQKNGKHRVIGEFETGVDALIDRQSEKGNADKTNAFEIKKEFSKENRGLVVVVVAELASYKPYVLQPYIREGKAP